MATNCGVGEVIGNTGAAATWRMSKPIATDLLKISVSWKCSRTNIAMSSDSPRVANDFHFYLKYPIFKILSKVIFQPCCNKQNSSVSLAQLCFILIGATILQSRAEQSRAEETLSFTFWDFYFLSKFLTSKGHNVVRDRNVCVKNGCLYIWWLTREERFALGNNIAVFDQVERRGGYLRHTTWKLSSEQSWQHHQWHQTLSLRAFHLVSWNYSTKREEGVCKILEWGIG